MRIGVNGRFYGARVTGVQRFGREITTRLLRAADHLLLLPAGSPQADATLGDRVVRGRLRGHVWQQLELPRQARRAGCDLVLNLSSTAPLWGGPHVLVVHDVTPLTNPEWFSRRLALWYRVSLGTAARRAARLLTFSRWSKGELERVLGVSSDRIDIVSQGVEPFDAPARPEEVEAVRERFRLRGPYLLATGAGNRRKNVPFLLEMIERWQRRAPPPPTLLVVGAGTRRVHGTAARPARAVGEVVFAGHVEDSVLRSLYTGAAVFLFPSLGEGFGRPPLEAMGCGTPVVASAYGPAREILDDAARIIPLDPDRWVDATGELMQSTRARTESVERGRCLAAAYRWDRAARQVLEGCRTAWEARASGAGFVAG